MNLLLGRDEEVAAWVATRIRDLGGDAGRLGPRVGFAVVDGEKWLAGVVFSNWRGHDVEVTAAADSPRWMQRSILRDLFGYAFGQLGCVRMTTATAKANRRARRVLEGLGFKLEGVVRRGIEGKRDAALYGMLRDECKWWRKA